MSTQLNDRFAIAEDEVFGPFTCTTCGASVSDRDAAILHNDWHDKLRYIIYDILKYNDNTL